MESIKHPKVANDNKDNLTLSLKRARSSYFFGSGDVKDWPENISQKHQLLKYLLKLNH